MKYSDAYNILIKKQSLGIKPGLERIYDLLDIMGNPQNDVNIIHIAGTNGKGTVSATVANCLEKSNYKVGVFTSPWVIDYREQIQINGDFIPEDKLAQYVEKYSEYDSTEFELLTAIMYKYFSDEKVDYAVVECGMGGLEDATNVEKENLSVIMSISIDHTNFLGNTVEKIAKQKAGIIRENSICILYPNPECEKIFENTCNKLNSKLIKVKDYGNIADNNLATVNAVLSALNCNTKAETLVRLPARQEKINGVLIDGGHNPSSAMYLAKCISDEVAVIGMMADKDVDKFLSLIAPKCKKVITTTPDNPRAISAVELKTIAEKYCDNVVAIDNPKEAVLQEGITLVCGSFFLARDVRNIINNM